MPPNTSRADANAAAANMAKRLLFDLISIVRTPSVVNGEGHLLLEGPPGTWVYGSLSPVPHF